MRLPFRIALGALFCVTQARAVTYEQWLAEVPPNPAAQIQFESLTEKGIAPTTNINMGNNFTTAVPSAPPDKVIGWVRVSTTVSPEKLYLTLYYNLVEMDDLINRGRSTENRHPPDYFWTKPEKLLRLDSPIRTTNLEQTWEIAANASIPLRLRAFMERMYGQSLNSVRAELRDAGGRVLARKLIVETYGSGYNSGEACAWTLDGTDEEITKSWPEYGGCSFLLRKIKAFPDSCAAYSDVRFIRVSSSGEKALNPAFLRRLLLMGLWVNGDAETVASLAASIGLPKKGDAVFDGGLCVPEPSSLQNGPSINNQKNENMVVEAFVDPDLLNSYSYDSTYFPKWNQGLIDLIKIYRYWTMILLGLFTVVIGVGVPIGLFRLKPHRRLLLWWAVPVFSFSIAIINYAGGLLFLPRQAMADVIELRFVYPGWPEMLCRTETRFLNFKDDSDSWQMPAGAWQRRVQNYSIQPDEREMQSPSSTDVVFAPLPSGYRIRSDWSYFAPAQEPIAGKWAADGKSIEIEALRPLQSVVIYMNGNFQKMGNLRQGEKKTVSPSVKLLANMSFPWLNGMPASIPALVLALGDEPPFVHLTEPSHFHLQSRVLWCVQLPGKP